MVETIIQQEYWKNNEIMAGEVLGEKSQKVQELIQRKTRASLLEKRPPETGLSYSTVRDRTK
jgi:hypothetical protein